MLGMTHNFQSFLWLVAPEWRLDATNDLPKALHGRSVALVVSGYSYYRKVMVEFKPCRSLYRSGMNESWKLYKTAEP